MTAYVLRQAIFFCLLTGAASAEAQVVKATGNSNKSVLAENGFGKFGPGNCLSLILKQDAQVPVAATFINECAFPVIVKACVHWGADGLNWPGCSRRFSQHITIGPIPSHSSVPVPEFLQSEVRTTVKDGTPVRSLSTSPIRMIACDASTGSSCDNPVTVEERALSLDRLEKEKAEAFFSSGYVLLQQGEWLAAEQQFRQGLAIKPADGVAYFYWGEVKHRMGTLQGAATFWRWAAAFAPPTSKESALAKSRLEEFKDELRKLNN